MEDTQEKQMLSIINGDKVIEWVSSKPQKVADSIKRSRQISFLNAYKVCGNITQAAKAAGINSATTLTWRDKDQWFLRRFAEAIQEYRDSLEQEIHNRAVTGVEVPIIGKIQTPMGPEDAIIGKKTVKSDLLMIFHAKRHIVEYRDRQDPYKDDSRPSETVSPLTRITASLDMMKARMQEQIPVPSRAVIDVTPQKALPPADGDTL